jgi:dethiobiotin synthetase
VVALVKIQATTGEILSAYFITGTGTDIGKTWLSCALLKHWRAAGLTTLAYKPVLSGFGGKDLGASDAGALLYAQGFAATESSIETISPWRFAAPLSPDMAAALEGREIVFADLMSFTQRVASTNSQAERVLIEGVGGVMVPLDTTNTVRDWIAASNLSCILVAGSYLGSLSHTLSALAALREVNVEVKAIAVNESLGSSVKLADTMSSLQRHAKGAAVIAIQRDDPATGIAMLAAMA